MLLIHNPADRNAQNRNDHTVENRRYQSNHCHLSEDRCRHRRNVGAGCNPDKREPETSVVRKVVTTGLSSAGSGSISSSALQQNRLSRYDVNPGHAGSNLADTTGNHADNSRLMQFGPHNQQRQQ